MTEGPPRILRFFEDQAALDRFIEIAFGAQVDMLNRLEEASVATGDPNQGVLMGRLLDRMLHYKLDRLAMIGSGGTELAKAFDAEIDTVWPEVVRLLERELAAAAKLNEGD